MKEKLGKIRDELAEIKSFSVGTMSHYQTLVIAHSHTSSGSALADVKNRCDYMLPILDSILAELDSAELKHKVSGAIYAPDESCIITRSMYLSYEDAETCERIDKQAQAAIDTIKG